MSSSHALHGHLVDLSDAVMAISAIADLEEVLQRIVETARTFIDAEYAALGMPATNQEQFAHFFFAGMPEEAVEAIGRFPTGKGVIGVNLEGRALRLRNIADHPRSIGFPEHHPPMSSFLGVPIQFGEQVLGNLYLTDKRGAAEFSERDEALAELLARHAALAIHNARLHDRLSASEARYRRLTEGAPEIVLALDDAGRITFVNERLQPVLGIAPDEVIGRSIQDLADPMDRQHVGLELRLLGDDDGDASFPLRIRDAEGRLRHLEVTLTPRGDEEGGYQGVARDVTARYDLAHGIADRMRDAGSPGRETEQLRDFVALIIQAQEEERTRIAGDLHDTTVQTLTAIGRRLRSLCEPGDPAVPAALRDDLAELAAAALQEADEVRRLSRNLRPSVLDHLGLEAALEDLADAVRNGDREVHLQLDGDASRLEQSARTALFRIAQEALTNVRRHSEATLADVTLRVTDRSAVLTVRDNGSGFVSSDLRDPGLGMRGMRERAAMIGGEFTVSSTPGGGTTITAKVPLSGS